MTTIGILCLLFCGCFAVVNSQSTVDETSSQCLWNNDEYVLRTLERTSRPTQQLLMQMKQQMDSMSAQLMTIKDQQPPTTGRDVGLGKQPLVSALTGKCVCKSL